MSYSPITGSALQYMQDSVSALDHFIKFYASGTTSPISMATDSTGGTLLVKAQFNAQGYAINGSGAEFIPHIDQKYKIVFYPDAATADANDFSSAVFEIDLVDQFATISSNIADVKNHLTLAAAVADVLLSDGDALNIAERTTGNQGGAMWDVVLASGVTPNTFNIVICTGVPTLALVLRVGIIADANAFGASDGIVDDGAAIQAALDFFPAGSGLGGQVDLNGASNYTYGTGLVVPAGVTLDACGALVTYTGNGTAITCGTSDDVLSFSSKAINLLLKLQEKDSIGVRFRCTVLGEVSGVIEGHTSTIDNTRTNIGVVVDGVNISSFWNNIHDVYCNHMHEGLRVWSTGTSFPTAQTIHNFNVNGDQASDNLSVGINWAPSGPGVIGEGSTITGGYIEKCNTGVLVGAASGMVSVHGLRFETLATGSSPKFLFLVGTEPWVLAGIKGLGKSYISNDGIQGFGTANHTLIGEENGSLRLAGMSKTLNDTQFIALGGTNPQFWTEENTDFLILQDSDETGTGSIVCQVGKGSGAHGAGWVAHAAAHASNPGNLDLFPSTNAGVVRVTDGLGGALKFEIDTQNSHVKILSIPTASGGLPSGTLWSDSGTIKIIA